MSNSTYLNVLFQAIPKQKVITKTPITQQSKRKGSVLDHHRSDILYLRHHCYCSYGEIVYWLKTKRHLSISKTALYNRVQYWEKWEINDQ